MIMADEMWVHSETKLQNTRMDYTKDKKVQHLFENFVLLSAGKIMAVGLWGSAWMLFNHNLPSGQKVSTKNYAKLIPTYMRFLLTKVTF